MKTLISNCRYFKGEKENPYEDKDQNLAMLWFYESVWVNMHRNNAEGRNPFQCELDEYFAVGLTEFQKTDGIPTDWKAFLFNRYARGHRSLKDAVEPFKKFYLKYYPE